MPANRHTTRAENEGAKQQAAEPPEAGCRRDRPPPIILDAPARQAVASASSNSSTTGCNRPYSQFAVSALDSGGNTGVAGEPSEQVGDNRRA